MEIYANMNLLVSFVFSMDYEIFTSISYLPLLKEIKIAVVSPFEAYAVNGILLSELKILTVVFYYSCFFS